MAKLTITIDLDNAAFEPEPGPEVARILGYLAGLFSDTLAILPERENAMDVRDYNGNTVGEVTLEA